MGTLTTSVTALTFLSHPSSPNPLLLIGIGPNLHIHPNPPTQILPHTSVIHGITPISPTSLLIHGGPHVALVNLLQPSQPALLSSVHFPDRVFATSSLPNPSFFAVAVGHSAVWICDRTNLNKRFLVQSPQHELTWSTTLFASPGRKDLRAVAGTSFGDILSWTVLQQTTTDFLHPVRDNPENYSPPVHRLPAHAGPITALTLSPCRNRLATASVDRTVRVWTASAPGCAACPTGCFVQKLAHYGHAARVWDVAFLSANSQSVVSVGEDRSCRIWSARMPGEATAVFRGHAGRNVWTVAVTSDGGRVATGGEDGGVRVRRVDGGARWKIRGYQICDGFPHPRKNGTANGECGRAVRIVGGEVLMTTDFGRVLVLRGTELEGGFETVYKGDGTAFTPGTLEMWEDVLFAGRTDGRVVAVRKKADWSRGECVYMVEAFLGEEGMVMGLFVAGRRAMEACELFAATAGGALFHWAVRITREKVTMRYVRTYRMERVTKSALVTSICFVEAMHAVVVGDRGGRILVYDADDEQHGDIHNGSVEKPAQKVVTHPIAACYPHADRVSHIAHTSTQYSTPGSAELMTASFDGKMVSLTLSRAAQTTSIRVNALEKTVEHVDTLAHLHFPLETVHRPCTLGFRGTDMLLTDVVMNEVLFRLAVGNWRRAYDVMTSLSFSAEQLRLEGATVAFWRGGKLFVARGDAHEGMQTVLRGGHGLRVNDVTRGDRMLVTAGEDGSVRLWTTGRVAVLARHVSAVNAVAMARLGSRWVIVSGGGRDEIVVWVGREGMWRDVGATRLGRLGEADGACQRVGCVGIVEVEMEDGDVVMVVCGRSDGSVVLVEARERAEGWQQAGKEWDVGVVSRALMNGAVLCCATVGQSVFCGDSRGAVCSWKVVKGLLVEEFRMERVHDGGVNCLDVGLVGGRIVVVSGGDDERVCVMVEGMIVWKSFVGFHHAAVTGVCWVRDGFVSVGADMRVARVGVEVSSEGVACDGLGNGFRTNVPDPAAVLAWEESDGIEVVVVGCGVERFLLDEAKFETFERTSLVEVSVSR